MREKPREQELKALAESQLPTQRGVQRPSQVLLVSVKSRGMNAKGKWCLEVEIVEVEGPQPRPPHSQPWHLAGPLVRDYLVLKGIHPNLGVQGIEVHEAVRLLRSVRHLAGRRSTMDLESEVEQKGPQKDSRVLDWRENCPTDRQNHPLLLEVREILRKQRTFTLSHVMVPYV